MSTAVEVLSTSPETASDRVLVAAVRWQQAEWALHLAQAAWYQSTKEEPETATKTAILYEEYQSAQRVQEGALAELAISTRNYARVNEID